jgi:hypothetical protein
LGVRRQLTRGSDLKKYFRYLYFSPDFLFDKGLNPRYLHVFKLSGNNSVVECDLAKVEVAGSNPVSRSIFIGGIAKW